uniref:Putative tail protein n=1 Tax=viral metagenome TaxID=1070528 RepID=A0A6M3KHU0_9ZZZZ
MAELAGTAGGVYSSPLLVDDCEDAWSEHTESGCTSSTTTGKVGTYAARVTTVSVGADVVMMSEAISSADLSTYGGLVFWARTSLTTTATQLKMQISESAECATPAESMALPILSAATWRQCFTKFAAAGSTRNATISIGLYADEDLADGTFDIDDVYAVKLIGGIKSWTLDATVDMLDSTDFADGNATNAARTFKPGLSIWSGSFEGYKDGAPLTLSFTTPVHLALQESATSGQGWIGMAYITGIHPSVSVDGLVSYTYDFTGQGELTEATL